MLPYASIVAEAFGENFDFPTPVVASGGSSAGLQQFCAGVGLDTIDIANSSRPIRESEVKTCADNGVEDIIEVRIGYDGIVFASKTDGPAFDAFTPAQWYQRSPPRWSVDGALVANPHKTWAEVDPSLPDAPILAFVPGTKHGTREVFEEKVIAAGLRGLRRARGDHRAANGGDEDAAHDACVKLRTDGASVDIDGDYTETLARIESDPNGIGVFGLAFYENNTNVLKVATMSGITPSTETIASGEYPVSRPLFFYVKKAHFGEVAGPARNSPSSSSPTPWPAPTARSRPTASSPTRSSPQTQAQDRRRARPSTRRCDRRPAPRRSAGRATTLSNTVNPCPAACSSCFSRS